MFLTDTKSEDKPRTALGPKSHNVQERRKERERGGQEGLFLQEHRAISSEELDPRSRVKEPSSAPTQKPTRNPWREKRQDQPAEEPRLSTKNPRKDRVGRTEVDTASEVPALKSKGKQREEQPAKKEIRQPLPRVLKSSQRERDIPDAEPKLDLKLNAKTLEHLKPLIDLKGIGEPKDINLWHSAWASLCNIDKIAEGSFGSVFRMSDKQGLQSSTIGKLIPLKSKTGVGSRKASNTAVSEAASEVQLLGMMSDVPGFVEFRVAEVLIGALPSALRDEYEAFKERQRGSGSEISAVDTWYPGNQAWLFIEMGNAGVELDCALSRNSKPNGLLQVSETGERFLAVRRTRDIFWGVVCALAAGEEIHEFEHRDLHLSNICVTMGEWEERDSGFGLIPTTENLTVTIIDYTLSRATLPTGAAIFNPMLDAGIFRGQGDVQFDIYRHMRDLVTSHTYSNEKGWAAYIPMTNVLWLHLLLEMMMKWTPQPGEKGADKKLWELLSALGSEINLDSLKTWNLLSAGDVARYMEMGKEAFLGEVAERGEDEREQSRGEGAAMGIWREKRLRRILDG